jgi:hypothetical protein
MNRAWTAADILPSGGSLTLLGVATTTDGVIVEAEGPASARCPSCCRPALKTALPHFWCSPYGNAGAQGRNDGPGQSAPARSLLSRSGFLGNG